MRRIFLAIATFLVLFPHSSFASTSVINSKLTSLEMLTVQSTKGSQFEIKLGFDSFDGYLISADAILLSETANADGSRYGIYCIGYQPRNSDNGKVPALHSGEIKVLCNVPRNVNEGVYRLWNVDLASVKCDIKFVLDAADVNGTKCPWSNTLYSYRTGSPEQRGQAWATSDQISALPYNTEVFTQAPSIRILGSTGLSLPKVSFSKPLSNEISGKFINTYDLNCSLSSNNGSLSQSLIIDWTPRLPLNLAGQPSFNELTSFTVTDLAPKSKLELVLNCAGVDGVTASQKFYLITSPR